MKKSKTSKPKTSKPESENGSANKREAENFLIVGIGASAGGIPALKIFFENVPADSGAAYVVILHLSPDHDSRLAEVLQSVAPIPVTQVKEKVRVEPNHVYVVPPNKSLSMADEHIVLSPIQTVEERRAPVDIFFRTLAESHGERNVAVILSGTGADGSMGIKRVKENGGAAFVQNPREAEFSEMPRNSIATDLIDLILNVADIPAQIIAYRNNPVKIEIPAESDKQSEEEPQRQPQERALLDIFAQLRVRTGHDFTNYKRATILRRVERRINVRSLPDITAYAAYLRENADETHSLLKDLLISVTNFFRDKETFLYLENEILPKLFNGKTSDGQIRVWVAGCATGEEAYSLAMFLAEQTSGAASPPAIQIFATDIDQASVAKAREGFYTLNDAADVSPERLKRFFTKEKDGYRIRRELRERILFAHHNVIKDPPFSRLDLVTCRNMLIYLNHRAQKRVMETFHFSLNAGGYLFLGNSETVDGASDLYASVSREHHIYQSRQTAPRVGYPVPDASMQAFRFAAPAESGQTPHDGQQTDARPLKRISFGALHQQMLEEYTPSVVVNEEHDIVHMSESSLRFMQMTGGEPTQNLLKLIRPEFRIELRTALYQAAKRQTNVEVTNVKIKLDEREEFINISVRPVMRQTDAARGFILVLFESVRQSAGETETVYSSDEPVARQLEEELIRSKGQLRSSVEQYELQAEELKASNEELQAMNEELRSSSEELETGKEELQSLNEELGTVNQELKVKIEEISQTSDILNNLINSTFIGTIFLDRLFRIDLFTPAAGEIFKLIPADIGRPLSDIAHRLEKADLLADAELVLEKLQTIEREVRTVEGRDFMLRMLPYRTKEDKIGGVVLTFYDITERKQAEEAKNFLASIVESSGESMISINFNGNITSWNKAAERLYGYTAKEAVGKPLTMLTLPEDLKQVLSNSQKIKHNEAVEIFETVRLNKDGREMSLEILLSPVKDAAGNIIGVSTIARDITLRQQAEQTVREFGEKYHALFDSVPVAVYTCNADGVIQEFNRRAVELWGREPEKNNSKEMYCGSFKIFDTNGKAMPLKKCPMARALRGETIAAEDLEIVVEQPDGTRKNVVVNPVTFKDENGKITGAINCLYDISERKRAEESIRFQAHLLNTVEQSVIATDLDGTVIYWNQFAEKLYGWTAEEAKGRNILELTTPKIMADQAGEILSQLRLGKGWSGEFNVQRRDGTIFPAQVFNSPITDDNGKLIGIVGVSVDITERKKTEEQLSKAAEQLERQSRIFNTTLSAITDFAYIFDRDGRFIYANQPLIELLGLTFDEIIGKNFLELPYPKDLAERLDKQIQQVIETKNIVVDETPFTNPTGYSGFYEYIFSPVFSADGTVEFVAGSTRETTMRRKTEQALRESEERFRAMFEQASVGIVMKTLEGQLIMPNPGFCQIIGYTREEIVRLSLRDITHPDDYKRETELTRRLSSGKISDFSIEKRYIRKDGSYIWGSITATLVHQAAGEPLYMLAIVQDISERKEIEEALGKSQERLRLLIESAKDYAIFTLTLDNRINIWNAGAEKVFGWTESEVLGQSGEIIFTPEDRAAGAPEQEITTALEKGSAPDERYHLRRDGSIFYASGVMTLLKDDDGKVQGFVKICRDMTEQIEAEKAVRDKEMLQKLVRAQEDERKRIARDLHDELGQQLTALRLKLDAAGKLCEETELCGKIDEMQLIAKSIDNGVDFLAWELRPAALDDLGLVVALDNYVKQWSHHSGVTAELLATGLKRARFAPEIETNLYRIVQEALNNTHKHAKAKSVEVVMEKRHDLIVLLVEDDGIGFNLKNKKNRLKGLGLTGMKERAALVGGTLEIESAPGKGTTVFVRVPVFTRKKEKLQ